MASVTAIIPAYDEGRTIAGVLDVITTHPAVDDVIVVSDGSEDDTAPQARASGARVIELGENRGKGAAMRIGVDAARNDVLFFADADIVGLTHAMMDAAIAPVLLQDYAMFTLIRDRKSGVINAVLPRLPVVGGERALRKELCDLVPASYWHGYSIEPALNHVAQKKGWKTGCRVMPGLTQVIKERKRGFLAGLYQRLFLVKDILLAEANLSLRGLPAERR